MQTDLIRHAVYILEHNPVSINLVDCFSGHKPFIRHGYGIDQDTWREAWKQAKKVWLVAGCGSHSSDATIYRGAPAGARQPVTYIPCTVARRVTL